MFILNKSSGNGLIFLWGMGNLESISLFAVSLEDCGKCVLVEPLFPILVVLGFVAEFLFSLDTHVDIILLVS